MNGATGMQCVRYRSNQLIDVFQRRIINITTEKTPIKRLRSASQFAERTPTDERRFGDNGVNYNEHHATSAATRHNTSPAEKQKESIAAATAAQATLPGRPPTNGRTKAELAGRTN